MLRSDRGGDSWLQVAFEPCIEARVILAFEWSALLRETVCHVLKIQIVRTMRAGAQSEKSGTGVVVRQQEAITFFKLHKRP